MPNVTHAAVKKLFAASPLLDLLPDDELTELTSQARSLSFSAGETVFAKGEPGASVYWVVRGRFKLTVTGPDGSELLHSMIEPGNYCGEITAIDGAVRGVNAIADCSSVSVALDRCYFLPAIERNPVAAMRIARLLCKQIRIAGDTLENLAFHNAETRIWTRLIYLSKEYGTVDPKSGALQIKHRLSQQGLADSVGLTRVMVNRQLSTWREQGLIEDARGLVVIPEPKKFEEFVWRNTKSH